MTPKTVRDTEVLQWLLMRNLRNSNTNDLERPSKVNLAIEIFPGIRKSKNTTYIAQPTLLQQFKLACVLCIYIQLQGHLSSRGSNFVSTVSFWNA